MTALKERFDSDGFVVAPAYLTRGELSAGVAALPLEFPTADEFHDDVDPGRNERFRDEFGGITNFPFQDPQLSLLAVHERLVDLATVLLGTDDVRATSIEAWAKYTGAADYSQPHHRDYLSHTLLVPAPEQPAGQVEMFVYLCDVPVELGATAYVPIGKTAGMPALPNWYPRTDGGHDAGHPSWVAPNGRPDFYDDEVRADGPAGTVIAYRIDTFHRGTALTVPRGARYTLHTNFRRADADWLGRRAWTDTANEQAWHQFVVHATPRQLQAFGFPPPGHRYWTPRTLAGMCQRYPGFDPAPWTQPASAESP